ncbi:hypothetical protein ASE65_05740 [Sphingomonas sp. Leaf16]|nr:hypothetical protein ASE65_05740 [Sphingomonas sp. Leaf16]KQN12992.1 hypothetical protein ASE81_06755 [Sphingomonas sp. Leaf29]KQN19878.1 hypothetical protein ASE83_06680 [Sphingomonas sp. Leaf32]
MRRVAAVRAAQRVLAERALQAATGAVAAADDALAGAGERVEDAFATWRAQADAACFLPEIERHHAAQLIARTGEQDAARTDRAQAETTLTGARQGLRRADAAVEQGERIVRRLARRDRMRREERQLADHADRVTQRWGKQ